MLTSSCLANGFRRLFPWSCITPFCLSPIFPPSFKLPGFLIPSEVSTQNHMLIPRSFFVLRRPPLTFLSTPSPNRQTSLVSHHATHCLYVSVLSTPSPRSRTSPRRHCALPFKKYRSPSTSKPKLPTIHISSSVSQDNAHWTPSRIQKKPNQGLCQSVVHVLSLWIRFLGQDLSCVHSGGFGSCLFIWVCCFNDSRRST